MIIKCFLNFHHSLLFYLLLALLWSFITPQSLLMHASYSTLCNTYYLLRSPAYLLVLIYNSSLLTLFKSLLFCKFQHSASSPHFIAYSSLPTSPYSLFIAHFSLRAVPHFSLLIPHCFLLPSHSFLISSLFHLIYHFSLFTLYYSLLASFSSLLIGYS